MVAESGPQGPPVGLDALADRLAEEAGSFEFFQAVRLLERLMPERARVGDYEDPEIEVARFQAHPSLAFPRGDIHEMRPGDDADAPVRLSVNFMGMVGPNGVLPHHYTLLVSNARRRGDQAPGEFLGLFEHRMISLFYRAWCKHRVTVAGELAEDEVDPVARHVVDLLGLGVGAAARWMDEAPERLVPVAGLLAPQQRSAIALECLLEATYEVPAEVEQFVGGWAPLIRRDQCAVGEERPASRLGRGAVVGDEIWDQQARVRVRLGPLSRDRFDRFLPGGEDHESLRSLCRFFGHDQFDFEVRLVLRREDAPPCVLGDEAPDHALGWSTWVRTRPLDRDPEETILTL